MMAYVSPTINPSNSTLSTLKAAGLWGAIDALILANPGFTARQVVLIRTPDFAGVARTIDNLTEGDPISHSDIAAQLLDYATAAKAWLAVIESVAVIEAAVTRTTTSRVSGDGARLETTYVLT